ncbi:MAG: hypothetical protein IJ806_03925 [Ruminococcus sp.]|nr:hypothetical protein [Ruminococcus sp.]
MTQTNINETNELVHIHVNGETISATPSHPFYVYKFGWTLAGNLKAGDVLVLSNGELVTVEWVQHEILESPIKVYNFEVEDFHTYFVGENSVFVHNWCEDDVKKLQEGPNNTVVEVKNKKEADELLKAAFPDYQKVNGIGPKDAGEMRRKHKLDRFKEGGAYHKDYAMTIDKNTGKRIVKGHDINNSHSQYPHINIKRRDGKKVLKYYRRMIMNYDMQLFWLNNGKQIGFDFIENNILTECAIQRKGDKVLLYYMKWNMNMDLDEYDTERYMVFRTIDEAIHFISSIKMDIAMFAPRKGNRIFNPNDSNFAYD